MIRYVLSFALTLGLAAASAVAIGGQVSVQEAKAREKFDPTRDAANDIQNAMKEAKASGKRIILDVGGEWCSWCHKLDKFFEDNADVNEFMRANYVVVKLNFSK